VGETCSSQEDVEKLIQNKNIGGNLKSKFFFPLQIDEYLVIQNIKIHFLLKYEYTYIRSRLEYNSGKVYNLM